MVALDSQPVALVLVGGEYRLEVAFGVDNEIVDQVVRRRRDPVHRLQADVPGGPPVTEQPIRLTTAKRGPQVDAIGAFHSPGQDVVGGGAFNRKHRVGIDPQSFVDADGEQHHQMAHPRCVVDAVAIHRSLMRRVHLRC